MIRPALAALLLGLWQAWTTWADVPAYLVPSPRLIAQTLVQDWTLLSAAWISTLQITAWAVVMALLLGSCIAFVMVQSRWLEAALLPYAIHMSGPLYLVAALLLGGRFMFWAWVLYRDSRPHAAINTFKYSIWYLFLLFIALLVDHYLLLNV